MTSRPKFPDPPPLEQLPPANQAGDLAEITAPLWRIFPTTTVHAVPWNRLRHWGPVAARFDPHPPPAADHPDHGVLYAGSDAVTALAEAFGANRTVDVHTGTPWLVKFDLDLGGVRLLDLTGTWPTRAGASQEIWTSPDRRRTQRWARAISARFPAAGGVRYGSSMHGVGAFNVALWTPAEAAVAAARARLAVPLSHPALAATIRDACNRLGYRYLDT